MINTLAEHRATLDDLPAIIALYLEDDLGKTRELKSEKLNQRYIDAFHRIDNDPHQYLMVVTDNGKIVASCHLTLIPSLTFVGATRLQIEAVHVLATHRRKKIGEWMMNIALRYAKQHDATVIQLTTNKQRTRAKQFYERLGFKATHEGMKFYMEKGRFY